MEINSGSEWYGILKNLTQSTPENGYADNYHNYNQYQRQFEAPIPQRVDATTGAYYTNNNISTYTFGLTGQNSFTLQNCGGQLASNLTNFESYPQFNASLPVVVQVGPYLKPSVVDDHYSVYRTARLNKVKESTSSISVSAMKLNDIYLTMAIKKTAHVTYHGETFIYDSYNKNILNCSLANLETISHSTVN